MQDEDWLSRWQQNKIGFHDTQVNSHLTRYIADYGLSSGDTVFLPLCGKSPDIAWLARQGFQVVGIELSDIAIKDFFSEQELEYQQSESDRFIIRKSGNICLLEGNFFDLKSTDLGNCKLVYDRAALIALDATPRLRYIEKMQSIIGESTDMMLITLDYNQAEMDGPPFAVSPAEVKRHYEQRFQIDQLQQTQILDESPRWRKKGLTSLIETVYCLRTNA